MFVTKIQHFAKKGPFFAQLADDEIVEMVITRRRELHLDGAELTDDEGGGNDGCEEKLAPP